MPRPYRQVVRAKSREESRRRIVAAGRACVLELGYQRMRVEDVAQRAGVARASVFLHFRNKAEILRAVEAEAAERAGVLRLVKAVRESPPRKALLRVIREGTRLWASEAKVFGEFYRTAPLDDTLRPLVAEKEKLRRAILGELVERLAEQGLLKPLSSDRSRVAEGLWLLTGFATFEALTQVRGLSTRAATRLLEAIVFGAFVE